MLNEKYRKLSAWIGAVLAAVMLLTGILMAVNIFHRYNNTVLDNQDGQMLNWVRVLDNAIAEKFTDYSVKLTDVSSRRGIERYLTIFLEENQSDEFMIRLRENLIAADLQIETLMVEKEGRILASANGKTDYRPLANSGANDIYTNNDRYFWAFRESKTHADYVALLDMGRYYDRLMEVLPVKTDRLMLLDHANGLLIHRWKGETRIDRLDGLKMQDHDAEGLKIMLTSCETGEMCTESYDYNHDGEHCNARLAVLPANQSSNMRVTVALGICSDAIIEPLEKSVFEMMVFCILAVICAVFLIAMLVRAVLHDHKTELELKLLRQKNEEMEKLTSKTLELAHHQRLETIGTLTSSIAHEFNNLLTPIMGYSIMTLEKLPPENEELSENILEIYNASHKAKILISRLNELSRKGSDNVKNKFSMDGFVRKVMAAAQPGKPKQVFTEIDLRCGDACIVGNELQLTQMLLNLVLNAYQAMESKAGVVTVATEIEGALAVITVEDEGPGITEENMKNIFTPFFTTKGPGKGTGLGLAIAWQAAEAHKGRIEVKSAIGQGTVFKVYLPLASQTESTEKA